MFGVLVYPRDLESGRLEDGGDLFSHRIVREKVLYAPFINGQGEPPVEKAW